MIDIVIIGGGIAGLYCAYKIKKMDPSKKILLLEASDRLGGRAGNVNFHGEQVAIGAGIGRKNKDKLLLSILKELNVPFHEFMASSQYASTIEPACKVKEMFLYLKREYNAPNDKMKTFKQYAKPKLEQKYYKGAYKNFTICAGYTDYENECAYDTLYHYGFDDNYSSWPGFGFSWNQLIDKLASKLGVNNIHKSCYVKSIKHVSENQYTIVCNNKQNFECKKVIVATEINGIQKLLPEYRIYNQVKSQPFLRIYGKFSKESARIMEEKCGQTTIVPGPIHKIIPMDIEKGIYMIAYTDNDGAKILERYKSNTVKNRNILCRELEAALNIPDDSLELDDMVDFYWDVGTHYYSPMKGTFKNRKDFCKHLQRPTNDILVVGEAVSMKQGWVEGALESVENIIREV
jgi:hypothetical protein